MSMADGTAPATNVGNTGKPPWRPGVAGINALVFGPVAGGLVASANLRRMGQTRKAKQILLGWIPAIVVLLSILRFFTDRIAYGAAIGLGVGCILAFTNMQKSEFALWEQSHPQTRPANGWSSVGLGLLGLVTLVITVYVIFVALIMGAWWWFGD